MGLEAWRAAGVDMSMRIISCSLCVGRNQTFFAKLQMRSVSLQSDSNTRACVCVCFFSPAVSMFELSFFLFATISLLSLASLTLSSIPQSKSQSIAVSTEAQHLRQIRTPNRTKPSSQHHLNLALALA